MDLKKGMLVMLIGVAMIGFAISDTGAYTFTAKCSHYDSGITKGYSTLYGDDHSYVMCRMYDDNNGDNPGEYRLWDWFKNSNIAPPDSNNFYGSTPGNLEGCAYNSGARDMPTDSRCHKDSWFVEALSGKSWYGEFGAWTMCADN